MGDNVNDLDAMLKNLTYLLETIMKRLDILENSIRPIPDGKANWTFYNFEAKEIQPITLGQVVGALVHPKDCPDCKNGTHKSMAH